MAHTHTIVMNWNFAKGESVIESTLDTHSETGDLVPRYRVGVVIPLQRRGV